MIGLCIYLGIGLLVALYWAMFMYAHSATFIEIFLWFLFHLFLYPLRIIDIRKLLR